MWALVIEYVAKIIEAALPGAKGCPLGASRRSILTLIVRQGMTPVALGLILGLAAAILASNAIDAFLFGISRFDALTYAAVTALLLCVSAAACLLPARRSPRRLRQPRGCPSSRITNG